MHRQGQFPLRGYPQRETGLLQSPWITQQPRYRTTICNQGQLGQLRRAQSLCPFNACHRASRSTPYNLSSPHPPEQWGLLRGMRAKSLSHVQLFATSWTVAHQAPLSMGFWSGLPCPPPGDLPSPGIEAASTPSPAWAGRFFTTSATWEAHFLRDSSISQKRKPYSLSHPEFQIKHLLAGGRLLVSRCSFTH